MLHPTVRLVVWGAAVAATQVLPLAWLLGIAGLAFPSAAWLARRPLFLLLRRSRWLLLSILLLFAFATPGLLLLPAAGSFSPTQEGLVLGLTHFLRVALVIAALAVLVGLTSLDDLVAGLHGLLRPLDGLGPDRGRIALRIMLVLRYVEEAPRGGHWREWLEHAETPAEGAVVRLGAAPLRAADYATLAGLAALAAASWSWA